VVIWGGSEIGGRGSRNFLGHFQQIINIFLESSTKPSRLAPLLGDLVKGGGLGAWPQKCMERPQVGGGGVFRQITSS
jgi:hypothetical protein